MFKNLLLGSVLLITFVCGVVIGTYKMFPLNKYEAVKNSVSSVRTKSFENPYYLHKTTFFKLNAQSDYDVVFVGDSITDGSDWYDIFPNLTIANRGIGGDITAGVLNRMDTIINTKAEKAFVMIGTNDIARGVDIETIFKNQTRIIDLLISNNIKPYVQSILLTNNNPKRDNAIIEKVNDMIKTYCDENNIEYIDLNIVLSKENKLNNEYSSDGLHLNGKGYELWAEAIKEYVVSSPSLL